MASVAFEHVGKTYPNGYRALVEFDLAIGDGELVVFVGPSGCGKSTLLRLVAGLEQPSSGHLRIGRDIVDDWTPQARNVAMVFQDYALYPTMTVRANLGFPLQMRKLPQAEIRRRVAWATELLALGDLLDRLPKQLSGGQRQRVAMGRALVREPTVFLLDEPLSNLDAQLRTQVRGEIVDLQRRTGTTMIYVTHDQVEAMTMGQRIAVLSRGHLQQSGSPQALYDTPANTFVAGFIGTPPMNLIPSVTLLRAAECAAAAGGHSGMEWLAALTADPDCHTAGIRPEHVAINRDPQAPGLPGTIVQTEYLGHETLVHFSFSGLAHGDTRAIFIARVDGSPCFENGQPASVWIDGKQLSRFDGNGNRTLGGDPDSAPLPTR
ncbi:ABC transporter ATP-binding protein [Methylotetracoccus oryzae]|uniref:ABC transporter ATP-binding protein n=1 Tax=Methylotetracoccus oryzae TaxID=1919059 RepID=UPI00111B99AE|nr:ABC transporter ATP-binding protein [Methylotetracoccus oryzae]